MQPDTQAIDILEHDPIHQAAGSENVPGPCLAYSLKEQLENLSSAGKRKFLYHIYCEFLFVFLKFDLILIIITFNNSYFADMHQ